MSFPWHFVNISRLRAEELLLNSKKNGSFLLRDSESIPNAHVLCLLLEGRIHHYRILRDGSNGNFFMQAVPGVSAQGFSKLEDLVTFYSQANQGLPCELRQPAVQELEEKEVIDDETDDEDDDFDETDSKPSESDYEIPPGTFMNTMDQLESDRMDQGFQTALGMYLGEGLKRDMETANSGGATLDGMQTLLATTSPGLIQELQSFLVRVDMLQKVFSLGDHNKLQCSLPDHSTEEELSFKLLMDLLAESIAGAKSLQTQAVKVLKDVARTHQQNDNNQGPEHHKRIFEVMTQGMATSSFKNKMFLSVNYLEGKISFLKSPSETMDPSNTSDQSKVLQLIKSRTNIKRLGLTLESKPLKEFEFDDGKSREVFCQLVQQMKNKFSKSKMKNPVSIFVGTWNMGNANPVKDFRSWLKCQGHGKTRDSALAQFPYDIYAFGTQECPVNEKDWIARLKHQLTNIFPETEFHTVGVCTLWSIRLVVFVNQALKHMITHVQQSSVKTGIANALGNKGGVGISFCLGSVSLCFINCHLAARSERVLRRNQNFLDILNGLNLGQKGVFGITEQFHHVFWFGDLNYRIDMDVEEVVTAVKCNNFGKLKFHDQLKEQKDKGNVLLGFEEESISFPPTYRYKRGNKEYGWKKVKRSGILINVPSWCDRVLKHSYPQTRSTCTSYGCTDNLRTSDHWPVFSTFDVTLPLAVVPDQDMPKSPTKGECKIIFHSITAKIKTNSKTQFYIEFHSTCLEEMKKSERNNVLSDSSKWKSVTEPRSESAGEDSSRHSYPTWNAILPELHPIMADQHYLEEQHVLMAVKSVDNDESYGECCIALKTMINVLPQKSGSIVLSHSGEKTGEIMVEMHVKLPDNNNVEPSRSSADLIRVADLEEMARKGSIKSPKVRNRRSLQPQDSLPLPERPQEHPKEAPVALPKRHSVPFMETKENRAPPPLPAKRSKPKTVEEMMQKIGFPQYTPNLVEYGWDSLDFLNEITETDLDEANIPKEHWRMILAAIKRFTS